MVHGCDLSIVALCGSVCVPSWHTIPNAPALEEDEHIHLGSEVLSCSYKHKFIQNVHAWMGKLVHLIQISRIDSSS